MDRRTMVARRRTTVGFARIVGAVLETVSSPIDGAVADSYRLLMSGIAKEFEEGGRGERI
jgi:hypothetical protein